MKIIDLSTDKTSALILGRKGETGVTSFKFDYSSWEEKYGSGVFTLVARRSDGNIYPVVCPEGVWTINAYDSGEEGFGAVSARYSVDGKVKKSNIFITRVLTSIDPDDPTNDEITWFDQLMDMVSDLASMDASLREYADGKYSSMQTVETSIENEARLVREYISDRESAIEQFVVEKETSIANSAREIDNASTQAKDEISTLSTQKKQELANFVIEKETMIANAAQEVRNASTQAKDEIATLSTQKKQELIDLVNNAITFTDPNSDGNVVIGIGGA